MSTSNLDTKPADSATGPSNFVREIIIDDLKTNKFGGKVHTRFPPEPNGYLHIGHAKSINLNFGLAQKTADSRCHLRFDDTNPETEEVEFVESIQNDVRWLGAEWGTHLYYASDYFPKLYELAEKLIRDGKAYVDTQTTEQIRAGRGDFHHPGVESPFRNRSVEENLELFRKMRDGGFEEGAAVLRAKIDMASKDLK